uniref:Structural envelope protein n=1 Tax=Siphoviridae sp. ctHip2 TaxID=2827830 RepID=A0A8S5RWW0_9CAUD|nr:MAG TPA: structural envelope protein [Siphoviridae sp. ctHip2]
MTILSCRWCPTLWRNKFIGLTHDSMTFKRCSERRLLQSVISTYIGRD